MQKLIFATIFAQEFLVWSFFLLEVKLILACVCYTKIQSWIILYKQQFSTIKAISNGTVSYGNEVSLSSWACYAEANFHLPKTLEIQAAVIKSGVPGTGR